MPSDCCPDGYCLKCKDRGCMRTLFIKDIRDPDKKHALQLTGCKEFVHEAIEDLRTYYGALSRIPTAEEMKKKDVE